MVIHDYGRPEPPDGERRWTTEEVRQEFDVHFFAAPRVHVTRKEDGVKGTMEFVNNPRSYFDFRPDDR